MYSLTNNDLFGNLRLQIYTHVELLLKTHKTEMTLGHVVNIR